MTFYRDVLIGNDVRNAHTVVALEHVKDGATAVHVDSDGYGSRWERACDDTLTFQAAESWIMTLPEFAEYEDSRAQLLDEVGDILTDEQAVLVPDVYKEWRVGAAYTVGERVRHNGVLYKCLQTHASQAGWEPGVAPSLWARVLAPEGEIPVWEQPDSTNPYMRGDKVHYPDIDGPVYESLIDNNTWSPEAYPQGWQRLLEEV